MSAPFSSNVTVLYTKIIKTFCTRIFDGHLFYICILTRPSIETAVHFDRETIVCAINVQKYIFQLNIIQ